jgi:hypothetical protein
MGLAPIIIVVGGAIWLADKIAKYMKDETPYVQLLDGTLISTEILGSCEEALDLLIDDQSFAERYVDARRREWYSAKPTLVDCIDIEGTRYPLGDIPSMREFLCTLETSLTDKTYQGIPFEDGSDVMLFWDAMLILNQHPLEWGELIEGPGAENNRLYRVIFLGEDWNEELESIEDSLKKKAYLEETGDEYADQYIQDRRSRLDMEILAFGEPVDIDGEILYIQEPESLRRFQDIAERALKEGEYNGIPLKRKGLEMLVLDAAIIHGDEPKHTQPGYEENFWYREFIAKTEAMA